MDHPGWFRLTFGRQGALAGLSGTWDGISWSQVLVLLAPARVVPPELPGLGHARRGRWALGHGLGILVIERVFRQVHTDEARVEAARAAIHGHVARLRARWGEPGPPRRSRTRPSSRPSAWGCRPAPAARPSPQGSGREGRRGAGSTRA